jgi:hypothetical protein
VTHSELTPTSHGDAPSAWHHRAGSEAWTTPAGRPCVVMARGLGATKDAGLTPFAERCAAVERVARRARGRVEVERFDVGHFDICVGEVSEKSVAAQVAFLDSVLTR